MLNYINKREKYGSKVGKSETELITRHSQFNTYPRFLSATFIIRDMVSCLAFLVCKSECSVQNMQLYQPGIELYHT